MNLSISDEIIESLVQEQVSKHLEQYKIQFFTVDIKKLSELTSLSKSTLYNEFTCENEFIEVTKRIGSRVVYLYPECMDAYRKILERKYSK